MARALSADAPEGGRQLPAGVFGALLSSGVGNSALSRVLRSPRAESTAESLPPTAEAVPGDAGRPLPAQLRGRFEAGLGADLSAVRVHTGPAAGDLARRFAARAYTIGSDIVVGEASTMDSGAGMRLLAHEVAHVAQTGGVASGSGVSSPGDPAEQAADQIADRLVTSTPTPADQAVQREAAGTVHATPARQAAGQAVLRMPTEEASKDVLPPSFVLTAGGDQFRVSFARSADGERLEVSLQYDGPLPFEGFVRGNRWTGGVAIGGAPLAARIREQTATSVLVDLYSDGSRLLRFTDTPSVDLRRQTLGRQHSLSLSLNTGGGEASTVWVRDPNVHADDIPAARPAEVPGTNPASVSFGGDLGSAEIVLDGDGDQRKELVLRLRKENAPDAAAAPGARLRLSLQQITGEQLFEAVGVLPAPATNDAFFPLVRGVTDGHAPTRISLIVPMDTQWLTITPPDPTSATPVYALDWAGRHDSVPARSRPTGQLGQTVTPGLIGGILYNDVKLGAYEDGFRLTLQPLRDNRALLGVSALFRGEALGGYGVEIPAGGVYHFQTLAGGATSMSFDLDGDGKPDLQLFDRLTTPDESSGGGPPERNRNHTLRLVGAAVGGEKTFDFRVRDGFPQRSGESGAEGKSASSNALAVSGLREQAANPTFESQLDAYESAMMRVRAEAAKSGALAQATYDAWAALSAAMIRLRPQIAVSQVQGGLRDEAAKHAGALFAALAADTASTGRLSFSQVGSVYKNEYTGQVKVDIPFNASDTGAGPQLAGEIAAGKWEQAFADYQRLVTGLDRWIVRRLEETKGKRDETTQQAQYLVSSRAELGALEQYGAKRVLAVFHPDAQFTAEGGYRPEIPLNLYYYRDGGTWYLKNLTNPEKPHHYKVDAKDGETVPPPALFRELNDSDRLPAGVVHYDIPGSYASQVVVTPELTWRGFLTWLGIGLAVVGLSLATMGTGTVAVLGSWALAGSAVAGGIAAGLDIADHVEHGDLTATTAMLDIAQIVGALAGVTALRAGTLAKGGLLAAAEGQPLTGAAAVTAVRAHKVYILATGARIGADTVTVATMAIDTAKRLDEIESGPGDQPTRDRAKALLLAQLAVSGGLTALSIKGELPQIGNGRTLVLHTPKGETTPRALVQGMEAPTGLKFSQKDIGATTSEGQPLSDVVTSMRTGGWKGDGLHVVELPDGTKVSLDNRRLYAAQEAKLGEVPVFYHAPNEPFPAQWAEEGFELKNNIRRLDDGTLVVGGTKGTVAYAKGTFPANYGEAALFRTANQGNIPGAGKFPLWGRLELPRVRPPKAKPDD